MDSMFKKVQRFYIDFRFSCMELEKGIIFSIEDAKQAETCEEFATAILIERFDLPLIEEVVEIVSIPVIASCRQGHFIEAKLLEKMGVAFIDESIESNIGYINKKDFSIPFICMFGSREEAMKRINEGAKFLRTPWGTIEDILEYISMTKEQKVLASLTHASPHDIAMLFQSGGYAAIISSHVFHTPNPPKLMKSLAEAAMYYNDIEKIFKITKSVANILRGETNI